MRTEQIILDITSDFAQPLFKFSTAKSHYSPPYWLAAMLAKQETEMATPPKPTLSASEISALRASILLPPRHLATDPIDMDHIFQLDATLAKQLMAQRLETQAEVHRAMAAGSAKAAALLK